MLLYIIKEKVCPHLAINHSVHPPQWQSEGAADWNIKHQCVRSECRQIKGQLHNVGERLLMNEVLACASFRAKTHSGTWCFYTDKQCFQPTEEKLEKPPRVGFTSDILCLNWQFENIWAFMRNASAHSAERVELTGSRWPVHTSKHSTVTEMIQPSVSH